MALLSKEELLNIAHLSSLKLDEAEVDTLINEISTILSYVEQIQSADILRELAQSRPVNVMREDVAVKKESSVLLDLAPVRDGNYFVVPSILDEK
jgi:aspartyl-tRNA(Asn)/glutamyl-tRNA(Gln) amidotransferase subunit C